jgi:hypothetical protein
MYRHTRRDLHPQTGIAGYRRKTLRNRGHVFRQLGLQGIDINIGSELYHGIDSLKLPLSR